MAVRMSDIARKANLSLSTVSMILKSENGDYKFAAETVDKVKQIARELNYCPNPLARSLATGRSNNIMLILPLLGMDFSATEQECYDNGYSLLTMSSHHSMKRIEDMIRYARQTYVDGVLLMPAGLEVPEVKKAYMEGYPIVQIEDDQDFCPDMDVFGADVQGSIKLAVDHLYELGHRKIGIILPPLKYKPNNLRFTAWQNALKEKNIAAREKWLFNFEPSISSDLLQDTQVGNYAAAMEFMSRFKKDSSERPTGIIAMMDTFAVPIERAFISNGWRVPQDISIISTVSESVGQYCEVPLTSVNLNQGGARMRALRYLLQKISGEIESDMPARNFAKPHLTIRKSTAAADC